MARRLEDIRPSNHRTISDVQVESRKRKEESGKTVHISRIHSDDKEPISAHETTLTSLSHFAEKPKKKSSGLKWFLLVIGILVVFAGVAYVASVYFARASFTIVAKNVSMDVNSTYIAQDSTQNLPSASGTIPFTFITVRGTATTTVPATVGPAVSTKAQGPVTLYNSYSAQSQRLVAGTRISNSSGKVYRLTGSIVVPGYTLSSSKLIIPGSVASTIIADQPGDMYNITGASSVSDFKMIAYKGGPKYETIYARQTAPIVGGMTGTQSIVSPTVVASSTVVLRASMTSNLLQQIHATLPAGYILFDTGYTSSFATSTTSTIDKDHSQLLVQGSVSGMLFKKSDLLNRLAGATALSTFGQFKYDASGLDQLAVQVINTKSVISMKIKGTIKLVGIIPTDEIIKKILGKTSLEVENIFKQYASVIQSVDGEVMPPWSKVPMNPNRVNITVK